MRRAGLPPVSFRTERNTLHMLTRRTFITAGSAVLGGMAAGGPIQGLLDPAAAGAHGKHDHHGRDDHKFDYGPCFRPVTPPPASIS